MAIYVWGVVAADVLELIGHPNTASPTAPIAARLTKIIEDASAECNSYVKRFIRSSAEAMATASGEDAEEARGLGRCAVLEEAAGVWLRGNGQPAEVYESYFSRAEGKRIALRYLLPAARIALGPVGGPAPTVARTELPTPWINEDNGFN